jgi:hypothetical protein
MLVRVELSSLSRTEWWEYAIRFVLGGFATVLAGLVAHNAGPSAGGLFLAFPAIFCASATLIDRHERTRKERQGLEGERRGRYAAALDAAGAGLGSLALVAFGAVVSEVAPMGPIPALSIGLACWLVVAVTLWWLRRYVRSTRS